MTKEKILILVVASGLVYELFHESNNNLFLNDHIHNDVSYRDWSQRSNFTASLSGDGTNFQGLKVSYST